MSTTTPNLIEALQGADMLEIDGLHAWQFDLDEKLLAQPTADATQTLLRVECIDGRERRQWQFSLVAVQAARHSTADDCWELDSAEATHRLKCFAAFSGDNLDDDNDD